MPTGWENLLLVNMSLLARFVVIHSIFSKFCCMSTTIPNAKSLTLYAISLVLGYFLLFHRCTCYHPYPEFLVSPTISGHVYYRAIGIYAFIYMFSALVLNACYLHDILSTRLLTWNITSQTSSHGGQPPLDSLVKCSNYSDHIAINYGLVRRPGLASLKRRTELRTVLQRGCPRPKLTLANVRGKIASSFFLICVGRGSGLVVSSNLILMGLFDFIRGQLLEIIEPKSGSWK